ncbi:hypothetical protein AtDm6_0818 [Acetobacter tropicalis]|uniref:Uncharacterized protein n=1 Tax=Acetobacter tropicalis TaxID=104102 RepID=A0A094YUM6_9PROT|nr:hypothetical protein AtDm6_0818 [Acetobacter tropicalis]
MAGFWVHARYRRHHMIFHPEGEAFMLSSLQKVRYVSVLRHHTGFQNAQG